MDDDPGLDREKQALSFNPFGDSFLPSDGNHNTVDSTRDREETEQARIQLENLQIPTGNEARTGSNASSAISGHTNPLFDALDAKPGPPPGSPKPTVVASFLNPAAESYAPGSPAASSMHKVPSSSSSMSAGVSINMGAGTGPRRHRLSSASSVKSTRSRRSTSSSFSSLGSKVQQDVDPDVTLSKVSETAVAASALSGTPPPPPTARPGMRQTHSQESTLSLQPSVMSLETVARTPPPVAGYRIPATGSLRHASFPQLNMCGPAFRDLDQHPIYVCSAILGTAIHPAKAGPHLSPPVRMSFAGKEILHEGRFDLLPITTDMKWYDAKDGGVPEGREPIQGGYEESGEQLYHALARINGFWVPGKTGVHLKGANFPFAGREVRMRDGYRILCWKTRGASAPPSETTDTTEKPDFDGYGTGTSVSSKGD